MGLKIKRFIETALVFFAGNMLAKLVAFFLLPLYTSKLIPEQYGTYDIVLSLINLIAPVAFLQIWDGMFRYAFDYTEEDDKYTVINNTLIVYLAGVIGYVVLFTSVFLYFRFEYFTYALLYGFMISLQYVFTYSARLFLRNKLFVLSGIVNTVLTAGLNVFFISVLNWDVKSLYIAPTIGCILQILVIEANLGITRHFKFKKVDRILVKQLIRFSIPLCVASISYWLLSGFTKLIILDRLGSYANGLYAVANRFASMITIVVTVFQFAWNETAYLMANDENRTESYNICIDIMLKCVFFGSSILCLLLKILFPFFINPQYGEACVLIPAAVIGVGMNSLAGFFGTLFMTEKKTNYILYSTLAAAAINVGLCILLTYLAGLMGALIALTIAFTFLMTIRLLKLVKNYGVKIQKANLILVVVLSLSIVVFYSTDSNAILSVVVVILFALFVFSLKRYVAMIYHSIKGNRTNETFD